MLTENYRLKQNCDKLHVVPLSSTLDYDLPIIKGVAISDHKISVTITRKRDDVVTHSDVFVNPSSLYLRNSLISELGTGTFSFDFTISSGEITNNVSMNVKIER